MQYHTGFNQVFQSFFRTDPAGVGDGKKTAVGVFLRGREPVGIDTVMNNPVFFFKGIVGGLHIVNQTGNANKAVCVFLYQAVIKIGFVGDDIMFDKYQAYPGQFFQKYG